MRQGGVTTIRYTSHQDGANRARFVPNPFGLGNRAITYCLICFYIWRTEKCRREVFLKNDINIYKDIFLSRYKRYEGRALWYQRHRI